MGRLGEGLERLGQGSSFGVLSEEFFWSSSEFLWSSCWRRGLINRDHILARDLARVSTDSSAGDVTLVVDGAVAEELEAYQGKSGDPDPAGQSTPTDKPSKACGVFALGRAAETRGHAGPGGGRKATVGLQYPSQQGNGNLSRGLPS